MFAAEYEFCDNYDARTGKITLWHMSCARARFYSVHVTEGFCDCPQAEVVRGHNDALIAAGMEPMVRCKHAFIVAQSDLSAFFVPAIAARIAVPEPHPGDIAEAQTMEPIEPANEYSYSQRERG